MSVNKIFWHCTNLLNSFKLENVSYKISKYDMQNYLKKKIKLNFVCFIKGFSENRSISLHRCHGELASVFSESPSSINDLFCARHIGRLI